MKAKSIVTVFLAILFFSCADVGGVRLSNNLEKYALDYIQENALLNEGEKIVAYYDYTISLDGTEAVILTNSRLIYHNKETFDTAVSLDAITEVQHRKESLTGDIIEVYANDGSVLLIEIAPLNGGETFLKLLMGKIPNS